MLGVREGELWLFPWPWPGKFDVRVTERAVAVRLLFPVTFEALLLGRKMLRLEIGRVVHCIVTGGAIQLRFRVSLVGEGDSVAPLVCVGLKHVGGAGNHGDRCHGEPPNTAHATHKLTFPSWVLKS